LYNLELKSEDEIKIIRRRIEEKIRKDLSDDKLIALAILLSVELKIDKSKIKK